MLALQQHGQICGAQRLHLCQRATPDLRCRRQLATPCRAQTVAAPPATAPPAAETRPDRGRQPPSYRSLSSKYAIVDAAGTQMLLEEGRWYTCNRLQAEPGSTIEFGRVLAVKENGKFEAGRPYLENVSIQAEILEELKGDKVIVYKMKPKKHYQRKRGHRQPLTKFLVTSISQTA